MVSKFDVNLGLTSLSADFKSLIQPSQSYNLVKKENQVKGPKQSFRKVSSGEKGSVVSKLAGFREEVFLVGFWSFFMAF